MLSPAAGYDATERTDEEIASPASFAQQRLWLLEQIEPGNGAYVLNGAVELTGKLHVPALERSLTEITRRHETLRTSFAADGGEVLQVVAPPKPVDLPIVDLEGRTAGERDRATRTFAEREAKRPFDLSVGPLFRPTLLRFDDETHVLFWAVHHIIFDAGSKQIFLQELSEHYTAFVAEVTSRLPPLSIQYADFAAWQRDALQGDGLAVQRAYWVSQLAGAPPFLSLPADRPRPAAQSFRGDAQSLRLPAGLTARLESFCAREGVTFFIALLAVFEVLLHRYTAQHDIVVGTAVSGRSRTELETLIGFFVNTVALRIDLSGQPSFRELVRRVREICLDAYRHHALPFEQLVERLQPERTPSYSPLFQTMFVVDRVPHPVRRVADLQMTVLEIPVRTTPFDLTVTIVHADEQLTAWVEYNADLFDADRMKRLLAHFQTLLEGALTAPETLVSRLPLLTAGERAQLVRSSPPTAQDYPPRCLHDLFEEQSRKTPDAPALVSDSEVISYHQLNGRANRLAHRLREVGVDHGSVVGVYLGRSVEFVVSLLGVLKADAACLPVDPSLPTGRAQFMLENAGVDAIVSEQRFVKDLSFGSRCVIPLDVCTDRRYPDWNLPIASTPEDLAYVIYTSGSTARPKGVEIPHRAVARLACGVTYARLDERQVFMHLAPLSVDASIFEIWAALLHGARCVLPPDGPLTVRDLDHLLKRHAVSCLRLTTSHFNAVIDERPEALAQVTQLLISGEVLSVPHVRQALNRLPGTDIINAYGCTEGGVFTCCHTLPRRLDPDLTSISIGRPVSNTQVYILDENREPVPVGVPGELYIGGAGVARGYRHLPVLTGERFVPDPFSDSSRATLCRTGDLTRYSADLRIEFLGRLDRQINIRGVRVEPEQVQTVLAQHRAVRQCFVLSREDDEGPRLIAYIVPREKAVPIEQLRKYLSQQMPGYSIPSVFLWVDALPLTLLGKVDVNALPALARPASEDKPASRAARDALEARLITIWERVLGIRPVAVTDNFFRLGGHSLLALRLFTEIEKACGANLPLATLFKNPTVERLAAILQEKGWSPPWPSLVAIQTAGSKPPLFCIHGVGGNVLGYQSLAHLLGADQPVYGLQAVGLDGRQRPHTRLEDMAAHYIAEIRDVQPVGPYYLGGLSFGGSVAFEMARQLQARGDRVALLALFDTGRPDYARSLPRAISRQLKWHLHFHRLKYHLANVVSRPQPWSYVATKSKTIKRRIKNRGWEALYALHVAAGRPLPPALQRVQEANYHALRMYAPQPYAGTVTLFRAHERSLELYRDRSLGWDALAAAVEIRDVAGDHVSLLNEPDVHVLARELRACLHAAQKPRSGSEHQPPLHDSALTASTSSFESSLEEKVRSL